jgi:hypothetical protein
LPGPELKPSIDRAQSQPQSLHRINLIKATCR